MAAQATGTTETWVPQVGAHRYAVLDAETGEVLQRGRTGSAGVAFGSLILPPNRSLEIFVVQEATLREGHVRVETGPSGTTLEIPRIVIDTPFSFDSDFDGLHDASEFVMGTDRNRADTDGDGIPDGAEVAAGSQPLGAQEAFTGIIQSVALPGTAMDVASVGDVAALALGRSGLAVVRTTPGQSPTVEALVSVPGEAVSVARDGFWVAVASRSSGLAVVDISDPPAARVRHQVVEVGDARVVVAADGLAWVGVNGSVAVVHLATGTVLDRVPVTGEVHDLAFHRETLLVLTASRLHVVRLWGDTMEMMGEVAVGLFAEGITGRRRLSVDGWWAYVTSYPGYSVVDLRDPTAPRMMGEAVEHGPNSFKQILPTGSATAVAAVGTNPRDDGTHDIWLYDVSDPQVRTMVTGQFPTPGITRALALHRGQVQVADGDQGFHVFHFLPADTAGRAPEVSLDATFSMNPPMAESGSREALMVEARDDILVREVEFYADGALVAVDGSYPFEWRFRVPAVTESRTNLLLQVRAVDMGGNATWSEAIAVTLAEDLTPPRVRPTLPTSAGFGASLTALDLWLSEPLDPASVTATHIQLVGLGPDRVLGTEDDVPVQGQVIYAPGERTARLSWSAPLSAGRYQARVTQGLRDVAENALDREVVWQFEAVSGQDTDGDGLTDEFELAWGLDPSSSDENGNGIPDASEDWDGDGLTNGQEMVLGLNPRNPRTLDNIPDQQLDRDGDFLLDVVELGLGTDWTRWDTDGDGWSDEIEVTNGDSPLRPNAYLSGIRYAKAPLPVLRLQGAQYTSQLGPVLRLGDGQVNQAVVLAPILRFSGPNEHGHTTVVAVPSDPETP